MLDPSIKFVPQMDILPHLPFRPSPRPFRADPDSALHRVGQALRRQCGSERLSPAEEPDELASTAGCFTRCRSVWSIVVRPGIGSVFAGRPHA